MINLHIKLSEENADLAIIGLPVEQGDSVNQTLTKYLLDVIAKRVAEAKTVSIVTPHQDDIEATKTSVKENQGVGPPV